MVQVTFVKDESDYDDSYRVIVNGYDVDGIQMNNIDKYTQAHIVCAGVMLAFHCDINDINITITGGKKEMHYPIEDIQAMAPHMKDYARQLGNFHQYNQDPGEVLMDMMASGVGN
jgi:hypothetical protein